MSGANTASLVGTSVAAFVAAVALFGIAGPILVWRASRTNRQRALTAIGDHNNGFLSSGLHLWPNLRLLQRVRAPMLVDPPSFDDESFAWDLAAVEIYEMSASWVNLGALLNAFQFRYARGDVLRIRCPVTQLPVNCL